VTESTPFWKISAIISSLLCSTDNCLQLDHLFLTERANQSINCNKAVGKYITGTDIIVEKYCAW
jgi:hypothetical protein